jgi:fructose-1,6-bisphosphatase II
VPQRLPRNLGLDLVRVTEAAALSAGRWMGRRQAGEAYGAAARAMLEAFHTLEVDGRVVVGDEQPAGDGPHFSSDLRVGSGSGPETDVVVQPIDSSQLLAQGRLGAMAVAAVAPRGAMWSPVPAAHMEKMVVNRDVARHLVTECLDAPLAWTLGLVARAKNKEVRDLVVFVLDRPRHAALIEEICAAGARVMLGTESDVTGGLLAASLESPVDMLVGTGTAAQGLITACAVKALGGAMLARPAPQDAAERAALDAAGLDRRGVLTLEELVVGREVFFSATGITDGTLLSGVRLHGDRARSNSMILRCETGTRRTIYAEHQLEQ